MLEHAYEGDIQPEEKNKMEFDFVKQNIQELEGRMLTIVEAVVEKDRQKATKDLVKDAFSAKYNWIWEFCHILDLEDPKTLATTPR